MLTYVPLSHTPHPIVVWLTKINVMSKDYVLLEAEEFLCWGSRDVFWKNNLFQKMMDTCHLCVLMFTVNARFNILNNALWLNEICAQNIVSRELIIVLSCVFKCRVNNVHIPFSRCWSLIDTFFWFPSDNVQHCVVPVCVYVSCFTAGDEEMCSSKGTPKCMEESQGE